MGKGELIMEGEIYTSIAEVNATMNIKCHICMPCLVCGEGVPLTEEEDQRMLYGHHIHSKICNECRSAILYMRDHMQ